MNLLPKSHKEFSNKDYWNKFFKKRGNKAFEWYGEYLELCSHLHKYIKPKDAILIPGCGNSSLSADLYDVGYHNIINIDVSEVVIRQMKSINANRKNMQFLCLDATNTSFEDEQFSVVLDKGTLDALMPDDTEETTTIIDKYFSEIKRVLKFGGRFVCISLLQSHILHKLLETFCDKSWMFRVVRCHEAEQKNADNGDGTTLPVFVVVATKFKVMPQLILEVCLAGEKMVRMSTTQELAGYIKSAQDTAFVTNGLAKTNLHEDNEVTLDLIQPGEENPRYTLFIVDQKQKQAVNKYAVFIVPQGRESEWLFGTAAGRRQLQDSAQFGRLVVAVLRRGHTFGTLDEVKEELAHAAKMLIPHGFTGMIPFLSLGGDAGQRVQVAAGASAASGAYAVEEVRVEGRALRRLVFLDNQFLVQSEAALKEVKKKNKTKLVIDFGHMSLYHSFICAGVQLSKRERTHVAVLGLGGGGLCMFLRKCYDDLKITAVDIDPEMLNVAKEHFELKTDECLEVQIKDGLDFLKDEVAAGRKYDALIFDMDSKDRSLGLSCPPPQFLRDDAIICARDVLTERGHFILNLVCRDTELHDTIIETLKTHFAHIVSMKLYEDVNEIIFATNGETKYSSERLEEAAKSLNTAARSKRLVNVRCVDLKDLVQSANIIS
ncbi:unnamed protein product [Diatraea saccharalis]|uniref:Methyltransferase domain-containing protein n=1 Tax=Diatraea saccharalis TaxID=40085 RepID=A0A9N9WAQ3_9NEOP|nr:unnamed protein product [Diatraea saccharalis]